MITKKRIFVAAFVISLSFNLVLLIKLKLNSELISSADYAINIYIGMGRTKQGMTVDEVINAMHHQPNVVRETDEGTMMIWETSSIKMPLTNFIWPPISEVGHIDIVVIFDQYGRVLRTYASEG